MRSVATHANDLRRSCERRWRRDLAAVGPTYTAGPDTFLDVRRALLAAEHTIDSVVILGGTATSEIVSPPSTRSRAPMWFTIPVPPPVILTDGRRRLRFTMKVPFWLVNVYVDEHKFPAPEGRFRGRGYLNPESATEQGGLAR